MEMLFLYASWGLFTSLDVLSFARHFRRRYLLDLKKEILREHFASQGWLQVVDLNFISKDAFTFILFLHEKVSDLKGFIHTPFDSHCRRLEFFQSFDHLLLGYFCDLLR